jgi:hypothetical protein
MGENNDGKIRNGARIWSLESQDGEEARALSQTNFRLYVRRQALVSAFSSPYHFQEVVDLSSLAHEKFENEPP